MTVTNASATALVTGMGCLCSAGANVTEIMGNIYSGTRAPGISQQIRVNHPESYPIFELPLSAVSDDYLKSPDSKHCGLLAVKAAQMAIEDAGLDMNNLEKCKVGVCIGTTVGNAMNNEQFYSDFISDRFPNMHPIKTYLQSNPADMIAQEYNLKGIRQCVANACSSGTVAIGQAAEWIKNGLCDIAIAGGCDILCRVTCNGFISLKIADNQPCRPFDRDRQGLNLGEGAGIVVLESDTVAKKRKAKVHATIEGYGISADAYHISAPKPDGSGLEMAINMALEQAGINYDDVAFINAHGTATTENDKVEGLVFSKLFPRTPFQSTKGYTGHTLGAAGAIEAIISIEELKQQRIASCIGFDVADTEFNVNPVTENTAVNGAYALSDSVAFGGNNAVLVFQKGHLE